MSYISEYWAAVNSLAAQLPQQAAAIPGQPRDAVFISSKIDRRSGGTVAGFVCGAAYKIAAQRIIDGSHELSSAEDIARFYLEDKERGDQIRRLEYARKQALSISAPEKAKK